MNVLDLYGQTPPFVEFGYKPKTTFWGDFSVAEAISGEKGIADTYHRAFDEWKEDKVYATELAMVLNHKIWQWYEKDIERARLYNNYWEEIDAYIMENWEGEDLEYYIKITD